MFNITGAKSLDIAYSRYTKIHRLEENLGAVKVELSAKDLGDIEAAASGIKIEGARYPAAMQQRVGK